MQIEKKTISFQVENKYVLAGLWKKSKNLSFKLGWFKIIMST